MKPLWPTAVPGKRVLWLHHTRVRPWPGRISMSSLQTRHCYCWCFFYFNHVKCLDLSREKRVPLPYRFLKGKSHLSLKSMFCLNNFQIDVFLPDSVCSVHSAFSCQCCLQETLLPTHHPSSKYLFCSQQLKGQNPHFPLLEAVLGALPIQTLPCASICWNLPSSAKCSVTVQAEINLPALWTVIVFIFCTTELFPLHTERAQQCWRAEMGRATNYTGKNMSFETGPALTFENPYLGWWRSIFLLYKAGVVKSSLQYLLSGDHICKSSWHMVGVK